MIVVSGNAQNNFKPKVQRYNMSDGFTLSDGFNLPERTNPARIIRRPNRYNEDNRSMPIRYPNHFRRVERHHGGYQENSLVLKHSPRDNPVDSLPMTPLQIESRGFSTDFKTHTSLTPTDYPDLPPSNKFFSGLSLVDMSSSQESNLSGESTEIVLLDSAKDTAVQASEVSMGVKEKVGKDVKESICIE